MTIKKYFKKLSLISVVIIITANCNFAWSQSNGNPSVTKSGDILNIALPVLTYGGIFYADDLAGAKQYTQGLALTLASTEILKSAVGELRPDGSNRKSFPSGHAASAFSASAFVRQRYGIAYAAPLYFLATYTGYTRVQAKKHYWHDIAGSLAVAELSSALFTDKFASTKISVQLSQSSNTTMQFHLHHSW